MAPTCARVSALVLLSTLAAPSAFAGGLEANGYNWDLLFDPGTYAVWVTLSLTVQSVRRFAGWLVVE